jgi:hypothetical protein
MTLETKKCFVELGKFLNQFSEDNTIKNLTFKQRSVFDAFIDLIKLSQSHNGWYT